MRQVADGGKGLIVRFGRHACHPAAQGGPDLFRALQLHGEGALGGGENHLAAAVEFGVGVLYPRNFASGDRMRRNEGPHLVAQSPARGLHYVGFGGADVHDQHLGRHQMADGFERGFGG